jgi:hypothetical protein
VEPNETNANLTNRAASDEHRAGRHGPEIGHAAEPTLVVDDVSCLGECVAGWLGNLLQEALGR